LCGCCLRFGEVLSSRYDWPVVETMEGGDEDVIVSTRPPVVSVV